MSALAANLRRFFGGLAGRLLAFTIAIVFVAALFIFAPALAAFHELRLQDRINIAQTAAVALQGSPDMSEQLQNEILENAEVLRIAMRTDDVRELIFEAPDTEIAAPPITYDLRDGSWLRRFGHAFDTLFAPPGRVLRVQAQPRFESGDLIEILINEAPLKREMTDYAWQVAINAIAISVLTGLVIYLLLTWFFVRPVLKLTQGIERFRDAPENAAIFAGASKRADEIGRAEHALADMAGHVRASLRQRERLAQLGAAVARIAHDLRNALSTAQLVTERLSESEDPRVRQSAPRLERAIGRAAGLAAAALRYGKAEEAAPVLSPVRVRDAVNEALDDALAPFPGLARNADIAADLLVIADPEQLHRVLVNLLRNAAQAASSARAGDPAALRVAAVRRGPVIAVTIADRGAGVPEAARANLFEPFVSAERKEGAGLGLAIARELARAQGGDVVLAGTGPDGSVFEVTLPAA